MKKEYWIEQSRDFSKIYLVLWNDGNLIQEAYSGTEDECERWIEKNRLPANSGDRR